MDRLDEEQMRVILLKVNREYHGDHDESNWYMGGCFLLAKALQILLGGGRLYCLTSDMGVEHVLLKTGPDEFLDWFGYRTSADIGASEMVQGWRLRPFTKSLQAEAEEAGQVSYPFDADVLAGQIAPAVLA